MTAGSLSVIDLRNAIERREIVPYFQPIVKLRSARLYGFEVLARWYHPTLGIVPPSDFAHLAEDSGLAGPLFDCILDQALAAAHSFSPDPSGFPNGLTLSVNISPLQLRDCSVLRMVRLVAERTGFALNQLLIEITETALVKNMELALTVARDLKAMGVRLGLDDFGTGYSSLYHLHSFPFDELKIARASFAT